MIEQVLNPNNIMRAYGQVYKNKGAAGIDGMSVKELYSFLQQNRKNIEASIRMGEYMPQAILGVVPSEARS
jgi:hypothetical protein